MTIDIKLIAELREKTQAGVMACKKALEETQGDIKKAVHVLRAQGAMKAHSKKNQTTGEGLVESYVHTNGKVGAIVELRCETDFVARNDHFKHLAHELSMQVASMDPKSTDELLSQQYIRDTNKTVSDLINESISLFGENITVGRFIRFSIGG